MTYAFPKQVQWQDLYSYSVFNGLEAAPVETPVLWMPADRQQRAVSLHNAMLVFNDDMARAKDKKLFPKGQEGQLDAWRKFRDEWAEWFGLAGSTTWILSSTDTILDGFEKSLAGWRDWYKSNIGTPAGQGPINYVNTPLLPSIPTSFEVKAPDLNPTAPHNIAGWLWLGVFGGAAALAYNSWKKSATAATAVPAHRGAPTLLAPSYLRRRRRR